MSSTVVVLGWLLFFSMLMFSLPFITYFGMSRVLSDYGIDGFANRAWSVFASVVSVNVIIALYAIKAWYEPEDHPPRVEGRKEK
ncbi:vacuolar ATPase assembly integral membrane protein vma21 [Nilaparvata lugens]|uniref:vacuolar ATPase assembly integral membrane protein vma21 n=1 Tax=Nilaparvata lugens TaxID=108931 RepID=UPI000B983C0E|nr:vacuolar ATPase assembly integral membrane protein vma21 [Nilaparvata lugens]